MYIVNKIRFYGTYAILLMTTPCHNMPLPLSKPEREEKERNELDGSASKFHKHLGITTGYNTTTYFMESERNLT